MPRNALAAVAAATLLSLLGFASVASAADVGFKGPTFAGYSAASGVPPTVSKPESKLWWNDGFWWAVMWDTDTPRAFHIFKLNAATHAWQDTGTVVDARNGTVADALWDGSKLYIASHVYVQDSAGAPNQSRLYRFSYDAGSDTYSLDGGFPAQINNTSSESLVIDKDSTGQLWATWTQGSPKAVMVNSTQGSDATWGTPFQVSANTITADGISSLVAFGGKIGVMWGDQDTTDKAYYFAIHNDTDPDATWSAPEVAIGPATCPSTTQSCADDHVNLKADSAGRVFAAVKTSLSGTSPTNYLLVRTPGGTWVKHVYGTADQQHTRAIVVLDTTNGLARMFATVTEAGGTIYEKTLPLSQADTDGANFPVGLGAPRLVAEDAQGAVMNMNNATSTKQSVSAATGLVVLATNKRATGSFQDYWHHEDSLVGMDTTPPVFQSASVTGSKLTLVYNEALDGSSVPATTAFTVTVGGVARPITTVTVSTNAVILRLLSPVVAGEAVTLSYTMPATGPIQDISGNDAASLTNRTATNTTPAGTAFDLIPIGDGTRSGVTANTGATTNLFTFVDDGIATPDDGGTYLHNSATSGGVAQPGFVFLQLTDMPSNFTAMSSMTIDVRVRTQNRIDDDARLLAQLFKADEVTPLSSEVQVALNAGLSNWVTISGVAFTGLVAGTKADWDGARVKLRWLPTAVGTPDSQNRLRVTAAELHATHGTGPIDTTPPVFQSATVNGASLTMTYGETLDAASIPAATAFAVTVGGIARGVSNVAIAGSTVTLTLASAVTAGQTVTVAYTKPATNPIQDAAGNDAVNLSATNVTNSTGGGGGTTFDLRPNGDGTRDPAIKTQSGGTASLFAAIDEGVATPDDATTYVRNDNGQSGRFFAQLTDTPATFGSMTSLRLDGRVRTVGRVDDNLTLFAQAVRANGTALSNEVAVGSANPGSAGWTTISNVNLAGVVAGTKADWDGAQLRLRWANAFGGRAADAIQLQLTAVDLHATYSTGGGGGDVTAPVFQSASVNGSTLTMTYNEALDTGSTPAASAFAVTVNGAARGVSSVTVTGSTARLTLASAVTAAQAVTVAYTKPATNPLQDAAVNDAVNLAATSVTNTTPGGGGDVTPPAFVSASVVNSTLTMTYTETLDPGSLPVAGAFAVTVNGAARAVTGVATSGTRVLLTLASPVALGQTVLVSYTAPASNPLQDAAGNDAASIANKPVSNIGR